MYIHSKYSFLAPRFCHPLRWIRYLCWAMPWSSSKQTCIRCTSESFFKKRCGIKQGPHFFLLAHPKKTWCNCVFLLQKRRTSNSKAFFLKTKNIFARRNGRRIIPKVEGTFLFSMGGCLGFSVETKIFFKRLIMGPRGTYVKSLVYFCWWNYHLVFLLVYFVLIYFYQYFGKVYQIHGFVPMEDGNQLPSFQSTDRGRVGSRHVRKRNPGCLGHIRTYMCVCVYIYIYFVHFYVYLCGVILLPLIIGIFIAHRGNLKLTNSRSICPDFMCFSKASVWTGEFWCSIETWLSFWWVFLLICRGCVSCCVNSVFFLSISLSSWVNAQRMFSCCGMSYPKLEAKHMLFSKRRVWKLEDLESQTGGEIFWTSHGRGVSENQTHGNLPPLYHLSYCWWTEIPNNHLGYIKPCK